MKNISIFFLSLLAFSITYASKDLKSLEEEKVKSEEISYDEYVPEIIWEHARHKVERIVGSPISFDDPRLYSFGSPSAREKVFKETVERINAPGRKGLIIGRPNWHGILKEAIHDKEMRETEWFFLDSSNPDVEQNNFIQGSIPISGASMGILKEKFDFVVIDYGTLHHILSDEFKIPTSVAARSFLKCMFSLLKSGGKFFIPLEGHKQYEHLVGIEALQDFLSLKETELASKGRHLPVDAKALLDHLIASKKDLTIVSLSEDRKHSLISEKVLDGILESKRAAYINFVYQRFFPLLPPFRPFMSQLFEPQWAWLTITKS